MFILQNFDKLSGAGVTGLPILWGYNTVDDNQATIATANYFDAIAYNLSIGDYIFARGTDGTTIYGVTATTPHVTIAANPDVVTPGSIVNSDINASAAIAFSKLAALTSGQILVGSAGNVPTAVAMSGDATIIASGAVSLSATLLKYAAVAITASQFTNMYTTPVQLVAAAGANTLIVPYQAQLLMTHVSANYAAGGTVAIQWDSTANGAGVIASTTLANTVFQAAVSTGFNMNAGVVAETFSTCVNKGLYLSNISGVFTTGDGTFVAHVWYRVIPTV